MRRIFSANPMWGRALSGVAPLLYFPPTTPHHTRDAQIAHNTKVAMEVIQRIKGSVPAPYTRKYTTTIDQIEKDIETLLGGAENLRKSVPDDAPMDKLTLMERCLRHGLWSYYKDEGHYNFDAFRKWLVYTENDEVQWSLLKHQVEYSLRLDAFKARRLASGDNASVPYPEIDWEEEYKVNIDREVVAEKRLRYDTQAINTTDKDDNAIAALQKTYRKSIQDRRLDQLVELLEKFKPVLAREAIMQRLTIKHLEGQLGIWRYLDWNPEVRDRLELEGDNQFHYWVLYWEEKRLSQIRLRSKVEVAQHMSKLQSASTTTTTSEASKSTTGDAIRDKLLKEVLALQARLNQREEEKKPEQPKKKKSADHH